MRKRQVAKLIKKGNFKKLSDKDLKSYYKEMYEDHDFFSTLRYHKDMIAAIKNSKDQDFLKAVILNSHPLYSKYAFEKLDMTDSLNVDVARRACYDREPVHCGAAFSALIRGGCSEVIQGVESSLGEEYLSSAVNIYAGSKEKNIEKGPILLSTDFIVTPCFSSKFSGPSNPAIAKAKAEEEMYREWHCTFLDENGNFPDGTSVTTIMKPSDRVEKTETNPIICRKETSKGYVPDGL